LGGVRFGVEAAMPIERARLCREGGTGKMLHLYFADFGAVVFANIVAVMAIAATMRRDLRRFLSRWPKS